MRNLSLGMEDPSPSSTKTIVPDSRPVAILSRQPVGTVLQLAADVAAPAPSPSSSGPNPTPFQPTQISRPPTPPPYRGEAIPIPRAVASVPLFDTFFDLVEADEEGGIPTPTPRGLLASVNELVQSISSSESASPEVWDLAREWRRQVSTAHAAAQKAAEEAAEAARQAWEAAERQAAENPNPQSHAEEGEDDVVVRRLESLDMSDYESVLANTPPPVPPPPPPSRTPAHSPTRSTHAIDLTLVDAKVAAVSVCVVPVAVPVPDSLLAQ